MKSMKWLAVAVAVASGVAIPSAMGSALVTKGSSEIAVAGMLDFATFQGFETDLNAKYAYFFWDRIALGARGMVYDNDAVTHLGMGLTGEYNFNLPESVRPLFGTDLVPFLGLTVDYRHADLFDETESAIIFGAETGVKFFLTDSTAISLSLVGELATEDVYEDDLEATDKNLDLEIGMHFYF